MNKVKHYILFISPKSLILWKTEEIMSKPLILISNDDGIMAAGVHCLIDFLATSVDAELAVVCPDSPCSGKSASITCDSALKISRLDNYRGARMWSVSGTPVDCVKLACHEILRGRKIDLMLAGINHGSNSAVSVTYSGTMGTVIESCIRGLPAVGFSLLDHSLTADFNGCRGIVTSVARTVLEAGLPKGVCLNVNIPAKCKPKGLKTVCGARGYWSEEYKKYLDPHGRPFYWLTGSFHNLEPDNPETDEYWLNRGWATAVPVRIDMTAKECVAPLKALLGDVDQ